ncbi:RING-H2 finger protein ATL29-like [Carica papaya]|uniref:RING-H2 finger protein ATL29-like n=1 Tax=Carica papaya TaxID=3649 RepID=UPI000B8C7918|nr:RING-H2 finger protein ATL29-like [Carica papaya]
MDYSPSQPPFSDTSPDLAPLPPLKHFVFPLNLFALSILLLLFCSIGCRIYACFIQYTEEDIEQGVSPSPRLTTPYRLRHFFPPVHPLGSQVTPSPSVQSSNEVQNSTPGAGTSVFVYENDVVMEKIGKLNDVECVICLEGFVQGDKCKILNDCNHVFHKPCIDTWLKIHNQCPICRSYVAGGSFRVGDTASAGIQEEHSYV